MTNKLFSSLLLILLIVSCAKTSDRYREGDNAGQKVDLTVNQERQLTKEALPEMTKEYPAVKNAELQAYITHLGQKLVQANKLNNNPYSYHFTLVDVQAVNAFALPAGQVFMTAPILAMADSEAEVAGVLGHEIGHVTSRHTAERMYIQKQEQGKNWLYTGAGAVLGGVAGYFLSKKICKPNDTACKAKFSLYGAGAGGAGVLLVQKYGFMKNSQEDELEADRVGFKYAAHAGYDKNKIGDFYEKLYVMEKEAKKNQNAVMGWLSDAMASHPPSQERVKQAKEMERLTQTTGGVGSTAQFQRMKKLAQEIVAENKAKGATP